jgi:hypothetical protein
LRAFSAYILSGVGLIERWEEYIYLGLPSAKAKAKVLFDIATAAWVARVLLKLEAHNAHFLPVSSWRPWSDNDCNCRSPTTLPVDSFFPTWDASLALGKFLKCIHIERNKTNETFTNLTGDHQWRNFTSATCAYPSVKTIQEIKTYQVVNIIFRHTDIKVVIAVAFVGFVILVDIGNDYSVSFLSLLFHIGRYSSEILSIKVDISPLIRLMSDLETLKALLLVIKVLNGWSLV